MIKRYVSLLLVVCMLAAITVGCGGEDKGKTETTGVIGTEPSQVQTEPPLETTTETEPLTEPSTEPSTEPREIFALDRERVVLVSAGETFNVYSGTVDPADITWTSDDPSVATIDLGVITAVAKGETMVYGEYEGVRSGCTVVCNIEQTQETQPEESTPVTSGSRDPVQAPPTNEVVDASFFDDAAFVGDSISLMLSNYCDRTAALGNATFLVRGSYGVGNEVVANYHIIYQGVETLLEDALADCGANKVFIMLGMNDIGLYGVDGTIENWGKLLQRLRAKLPDIEIYIQSMTPVWTGGEVGGLNNKNVEAYNAKLQAFAQANGCKYIDIASYMKDSTGGLATKYCSDSYVHLTEAGAQAWIQVLKAYTGY